ncbi:hypothetical protein VTK73DRAFT_9032 [Phialemonium thermophilum]|uniref:Cytochrome P450 n=1 Tax=Phialemonium thermophilum TaxID=223376 RepID=A0ABR3XLL1_9PEZI
MSWISNATVQLLILSSFNARESAFYGRVVRYLRLRWMFDAESLVRDSYNKYYDKVYKIRATEGVQVLIPPRLLGELKGLPEDVLSATEAVREAMLSKYTGFCPGNNGELLTTLIRTKLSSNFARLVPKLKDELDYILATELGDCEDWTPVKMQPFVLRVVARMTGCAFVGPAISRNEEWMDISVNYAVHVFLAAVKLQFFPEWLRPLMRRVLPDFRRIERDISRAKSMLQPIIEQRLRDIGSPEYEEEKPDDFIQWLLDSLPEEEKSGFQTQTELQLILSAAAIHTTTNLIAESVFDLAAHPEWQGTLRDEVMETLERDNGWEKKDGMARLQQMDSFIKEVQRLAGNITAFIRKVIKPIDLSDGTHLPEGTKLLTPLVGMSHDERLYPEPERFDALRFYRLRQRSAEDANRYQFTSTGDTNMNFGAGKHACPGRFFAANAIKMVLARFLLRYDIRLKDGKTRPEPMVIMMSKTPNPNGETKESIYGKLL